MKVRFTVAVLACFAVVGVSRVALPPTYLAQLDKTWGARPITADQPGDLAAVARALPAANSAVVEISGAAPLCQATLFGSGFVVAPGRVLSNAHVLAGVDRPTIRIPGDQHSRTGTVVAFDADLDLALIAVPELTTTPLVWGPTPQLGDSGAVAGYPGNGPLKVTAARVNEWVTAEGTSVLGAPGPHRKALSLLTEVHPGSSGGPLLNESGQVAGVIFATSPHESGRGYAIPSAEAKAWVAKHLNSAKALPASSCAVH